MTNTQRSERSASRFQRWAIFAGGFLGPFGTGVVTPLFPEIREDFGIDSTAAGWSVTAYFIPMALLLVVSGTLGERWGRQRVIRSAIVLYALASVLVGLAPNLALFLTGRALQGSCNAFITPLLIATLTQLIEPGRLGRAIGVYASFQVAGTAFSPFIAGFLARTNWRLSFALTAALALLLLPAAQASQTARGDVKVAWQTLRSRRLFTLGLAGFLTFVGPVGSIYLASVHLRDRFDMDPEQTGMVLLGNGLAALALNPLAGRLVDRFGAIQLAGGATALSLPILILLGQVDRSAWFVVLWIVAGPAFAVPGIALQRLGATVLDTNRGGGLSAVLAFRFTGLAASPMVLLPIHGRAPALAFVVAGLLGLAATAVFARFPRLATN